MAMSCTRKRSIHAGGVTRTTLPSPLRWPCTGSSVTAEGQKPEVQRLFQSGAYEKAVEAARDGDPASTFLAAQSLVKLDRNRSSRRGNDAAARERESGVAPDRRIG